LKVSLWTQEQVIKKIKKGEINAGIHVTENPSQTIFALK
jgi:hypothetical protein